MPALFANNASGPLAASLAPGGTTITLSTGYGAAFPAPDNSKGEYFYATLVNSSNQIEIVKCTQRINDSFVIARAQEGTVARSYDVGDKLELRITAAGMANKMSLDGGTVTGSFKAVGPVELGDSSTDTIIIRAGSLTIANPLTVGGAAIAFQNPITIGGLPPMFANSADVLSNKTIDTANNNVIRINGLTLSSPGGGAGPLILPPVNDWVVTRSTTDILSNKTLNGLAAGSTILIPVGAGTPVAIGYRDIPQNRQDGSYNLTLRDAGGYIYSKNVGAQTIGIPAYATTPLPLDMAVTIINNGNTDILIASGGPVLLHANATTTGNKTLPPRGVITALHVENDGWFLI